MNTPHRASILVAGLCGALLSGCAADDPARRTKGGLIIGSTTGAVLGKQIDDDRGAVIGAAIGAIAGGSVGRSRGAQPSSVSRSLVASVSRV